MKKTRWVLWLLILACLFTLVACEGETPPPTTDTSGSDLVNNDINGTEEPPSDDPSDGTSEGTSEGTSDNIPEEDDKHVHVMDLQNRCTECEYELIANILIVESIYNESQNVKHLIDRRHTVTVVNTNDPASLPDSIDALALYDEVILVNVANDDMPDGFDELLYTYVTELGGSLLTVCGNEPDDNPTDDQWTANAFTRHDMYGTLYQELLPVEIINYTPPTAVVFVVDTSGSMYAPNGGIPYEESKLYAVEQAITNALDALTERDYVAIISMDDRSYEILPLTSITQRSEILATIKSLPEKVTGGGTVASPAIERAGKMLSEHSDSINKHIVLITDGEFSHDDIEAVQYHTKHNTDIGITMSIFGINCTASASMQMKHLLLNYGHSQLFYDVTNIQQLPTVMRESLEIPLFKETQYWSFIPQISLDDPIVSEIDPTSMPVLYGFYGSKLKEGAEMILYGPFAPIYARWQTGKGTVGSFMCDLNGTWSTDFLNSNEGYTILKNIIADLLNSAV